MKTSNLQQWLSDSPFPGINPGAIDGIRGAKTEAAARAAVDALCGWLEGEEATLGFVLSKRSEGNLKGVHVDLQRIVRRAAEITPVPFVVIEGLRNRRRQKQLVAKGASKTMNSRHLTGHAVDLMADIPGENWKAKHYPPIADAMKQASDELNTPIEWGGDWKSFNDSPHFQLPRATYPA